MNITAMAMALAMGLIAATLAAPAVNQR